MQDGTTVAQEEGDDYGEADDDKNDDADNDRLKPKVEAPLHFPPTPSSSRQSLWITNPTQHIALAAHYSGYHCRTPIISHGLT